jgi:predicted NBD/HSP70 family sugar kinase
MIIGREAMTVCTYNRLPFQLGCGKECAMQNVFAGVDVGGTRIKVGLVGEIETQAAAASVSIMAAGIGCPGRIDFTSGRVIWVRSKLEFLEVIPLTVRLGDRLACPVVCDNDVNTILAGEMRFGAGRDCTTERLNCRYNRRRVGRRGDQDSKLRKRAR